MHGLVRSLLAASVATAAVVNNLNPGVAGSIGRRGADPKFSYDPSTSAWCTWWWDNEDGSVSCKDIPNYWAITEAQWKRWNPVIAESCDNYKTEQSYCVEADEPGPITSNPGTTTTTTTANQTPTTTTSQPATTTTPSNGITTPSPYMPGSSENCDAFYKVQKGDLCEPIAKKFGISPADFYEWNPAVGGRDCTGLWLDTYVCVSIIGKEPQPPTTTTTKPGNGISTPTPYMDGSVDNCDAFYKVKSGDLCEPIAKSHGASLEQFLKWNPKVGGRDCTGLQLDTYVCVSIIGVDPTQGNGIATPTPTQPGLVGNCDAFYMTKKGDTCQSIINKHGISLAQFTTWNPQLGKDCSGLWLDTYFCVSIIGVEPTPTKPGNGVVTPTPTQDGMTKSCKKFHYVEPNQNCDTITKKYNIPKDKFISWNPAVKKDCTGLWGKTYCCVAVL